MIRYCAIILASAFIISNSSAQDSNFIFRNDMETRADSVAKIIDSLITSENVFHFSVLTLQKNTSDTSYRKFFLDTTHSFLIKVVVDTTFNDFYGRVYNQVVIYFNEGYEFKNCFINTNQIDSQICNYSSLSPSGFEVKPCPGKLKRNWTQKGLDEFFLNFVREEIYIVKFMQKKYSNNN